MAAVAERSVTYVNCVKCFARGEIATGGWGWRRNYSGKRGVAY